MKTTILKKLLKLILPITILALGAMLIFYYMYLHTIIEKNVIDHHKDHLNDITYDIKVSINDPLKLESHLKNEHTALPILKVIDKEMNIIAYIGNMKNVNELDEVYNREILEQHINKMLQNNNDAILHDEKHNLLIKPIIKNNEILAYAITDYKSTVDEKMLLVNQTFLFLLFVIIFIVFVITVFISMLTLKVLQPLRLLMEGIKKITDGDLYFTIKKTSDDEIGVVIDAFNDMTQRRLELEKLAKYDALTGLYNHRFFYSTFEHEISRAERYNRPISLILIDIDHFKDVNDTYGHIAGDKILMELSQRLMKRIRTTDYACRYGGEEFTIILVETDITVAENLAEALRLIIEEEPFFIEDGKSINMTVSAGVSCYSEDAKDALSIFENADCALYKAKKSGRNQVFVFDKNDPLMSK